MSENRVKNEPKSSRSEEKSQGLFGYIETELNFDNFFEEGRVFRYLPHVLFGVFLVILTIANSHYTERMNRKYIALKKEVEDLRVDYITLKSAFGIETKQSEVLRRVKKMGLISDDKPPVKIEVEVKK